MICSVCNKDRASVYKKAVKSVYSSKAYDVLHCSSCDHFFTDPTFTAQELTHIYKNRYSYDAHSLIEKEKVMRAKKYAEYIASLPRVKSALEVGCMHGLLLTQLQEHGLKVKGVELDKDAVKYCQSIGLDVEQSSIEDHLQKASKKHDVIIMSHVIEHIVDPKLQLKALWKKMPESGRLVLITPNSSSLSRRLFGRYWGYWQVPVHINHFNIQSMRKLLKDTGFKIVESRNYGADSLFFLSTLANIIGTRNSTNQLSALNRIVVRISTILLRPWYFIGSEDMVVVAVKTRNAS